MDNGEEIPGLNEDWTFAGCKLMEWLGGFMAMILAAEFLVTSAGRAMPILVGLMIGTTMGLAQLRRGFPDEERGIRNLVMVSLGFAPPGLPRPAAVQPVWSGAPVRELKEDCHFSKLGLSELFAVEDQDED